MKASKRRSEARPRRPARGGKTDWERLDAMTEQEIERQAADDEDNPLWTDEMLAGAQLVEPAPKRTPITLKIEPEVLAFYRRGGRGYQTRMQKVLRAFMEQSERRAGRK